jgi:3'-phosphoadenosine 5'-phosphosulfate (PAPS) 3'-phosphatase
MHVSLGPVVVVASEAVRDAVRFMRSAEPSAIAYTFTKANGSPVTVADFVVQAFVASRLAQHFSGIRSWRRKTRAYFEEGR